MFPRPKPHSSVGKREFLGQKSWGQIRFNRLTLEPTEATSGPYQPGTATAWCHVKVRGGAASTKPSLSKHLDPPSCPCGQASWGRGSGYEANWIPAPSLSTCASENHHSTFLSHSVSSIQRGYQLSPHKVAHLLTIQYRHFLTTYCVPGSKAAAGTRQKQNNTALPSWAPPPCGEPGRQVMTTCDIRLLGREAP